MYREGPRRPCRAVRPVTGRRAAARPRARPAAHRPARRTAAASWPEPRRDARLPRMESWDLRASAGKPHNPEILYSGGEGRAILLDLPAGGELQDHQVHEGAWITLVDGEVLVDRPGRGDGRGAPGNPRPCGGRASARGAGAHRCATAAPAQPLARRGAPRRDDARAEGRGQGPRGGARRLRRRPAGAARIAEIRPAGELVRELAARIGR